MEVIVLAGGLGTRLQSVVSDVPKCMADVAGKPFLHYLFKYLVPFQPQKVILSLGYKHEVVEEWLNTIERPFEVVCKVEETPLGTGGAIKYALSAVTGSSAAVINGDTYFDVDLKRMYKFHLMQGVEATLALKPMKDFDRYGTVLFDKENNRIKRFEEKKYCSEGLINGGIYVINKEALAHLPEKFSMENDYFAVRVSSDELAGFISYGYFIDIGIPGDYEKAQQVFA